jgi:hypothetical protein
MPCPLYSFKNDIPVVNADQTVIIIWDAATHTQHFIRKASFKSAGDEIGFVVPTPNQPELEESGDAAFDFLKDLTKAEVKHRPRLPSIGIGCTAQEFGACRLAPVQVLEQKEVAGYQAAVLKAGVAGDLVTWLKENGFAYSPDMEEWAKPYIAAGWKFTALKLAKNEKNKDEKSLSQAALRISFKTDRPLFPYREPDPSKFANDLGARDRMLRIYFIADCRYAGELTQDHPWTGKVVWSNRVSTEDRHKTLELLKLPDETGPAKWWLTEFEDHWPYQKAPADLYFRPDRKQTTMKRDPIVVQSSSPWIGDVTLLVLAVTLVGPPLVSRWRRRIIKSPTGMESTSAR